MPILDPVKKAIAQKARLYKKICRECGGEKKGNKRDKSKREG